MTGPYQLYKDLSTATEAALRASIERFGVSVPVVKDQHGNTLDGHQRERIAEELEVDCPVTVREVADEDEGRALATSLNEDRRPIPKKARLPMETALREDGHSLRAIAGAVGVEPSTVMRDLAGVASATPATTTGRVGRSYLWRSIMAASRSWRSPSSSP